MKKLSLIMIVGLLFVSLASCTTVTPELTPLPSATPIVAPSPTGLTQGMPTVPPTGTSEPPAALTLSTQESASLAGQVDAKVVKISEIDESASVLLGDRVLVGVTFTSQYKGDLTERIQEMVDKNVKSVVSSVQTTLVTTDADLVTRIAALKQLQQEGKDAKDLQAEFEAIQKAINPA